MKLREIAALLEGELFGDGDTEIKGVAGLSDAGPGDITFVEDPRWLKRLGLRKPAAVLVKSPLQDQAVAYLVVDSPKYAFAVLLDRFCGRTRPAPGISPQAFVSEGADIGEGVSVFPFVHISDGASIGANTVLYPGVFIGENSVVGRDSVLYPNVTVREGVKIGNSAIIHAGAVIGADGFGFVHYQGAHRKVPQVGGVVIGDNVEIGANVTIDRATTGNTVLGNGVKIDNLVQIGHNARIGDHVLLVAQVAIGGSSELGDGVVLGGQVGVSDHTTLEAGVMVGGKSGVMGEVRRGVYSGTPAIPHRDWLKASAVFATLPELKKKVAELEQRLNAFTDGK